MLLLRKNDKTMLLALLRKLNDCIEKISSTTRELAELIPKAFLSTKCPILCWHGNNDLIIIHLVDFTNIFHETKKGLLRP
jgi:hypothetical protein